MIPANVKDRSPAATRSAPARHRARRADAGMIRETARDAAALRWLAQMYGAPLDLVARLLDTSEGAAREVVARWRRAGWVAVAKIDAGPIWVWPNRATATAHLGWDPGHWRPRATTARHTRAAAEVRLWLERRREIVHWTPERHLRHQLGYRRRGETVGHTPDAVAELTDGRTCPVEVELTPKTIKRTHGAIAALLDYRFSDLVLYVVTPAARTLVERVVGGEGPHPLPAAGRVRVLDLADVTW